MRWEALNYYNKPRRRKQGDWVFCVSRDIDNEWVWTADRYIDGNREEVEGKCRTKKEAQNACEAFLLSYK